MRIGWAMVAVLVVGAGFGAGLGPAAAQGPKSGPDLAFFEGRYELVGRGPGGALVERQMVLRRKIFGLVAEGCNGPAGRLAWKRVHEGWQLQGKLFGASVSCGYAVDAGNYPQLICRGAGGARLAAWPEDEFGGPLACR